jgi:hypothetical protein
MSDASMLSVSSRSARWLSVKRVFQLVALVLALIAAVAALTLPLYATASSTAGSQVEVLGTATALEVNGPSALVGVALPVLVAAAPLVFPDRLWAPSAVSAALLVIFVVVAGFSIGLFYLPTALVEVIAAFLPGRRPASPTGTA